MQVFCFLAKFKVIVNFSDDKGLGFADELRDFWDFGFLVRV